MTRTDVEPQHAEPAAAAANEAAADQAPTDALHRDPLPRTAESAATVMRDAHFPLARHSAAGTDIATTVAFTATTGDVTAGWYAPQWNTVSPYHVTAHGWTDEGTPTYRLTWRLPELTDQQSPDGAIVATIDVLPVDRDPHARWTTRLPLTDPLGTADLPAGAVSAREEQLLAAAIQLGNVPSVLGTQRPERSGWDADDRFWCHNGYLDQQGLHPAVNPLPAPLAAYTLHSADAPTADQQAFAVAVATELRRAIDLGPHAVAALGAVAATISGLRCKSPLLLTGDTDTGKTAAALFALSLLNSEFGGTATPSVIDMSQPSARPTAATVATYAAIGQHLPLLLDDFRGPGAADALAEHISHSHNGATVSTLPAPRATYLLTAPTAPGDPSARARVTTVAAAARDQATTERIAAAMTEQARTTRAAAGTEFLRRLASLPAADREGTVAVMHREAVETIGDLARSGDRSTIGHIHALTGWYLLCAVFGDELELVAAVPGIAAATEKAGQDALVAHLRGQLEQPPAAADPSAVAETVRPRPAALDVAPAQQPPAREPQIAAAPEPEPEAEAAPPVVGQRPASDPAPAAQPAETSSPESAAWDLVEGGAFPRAATLVAPAAAKDKAPWLSFLWDGEHFYRDNGTKAAAEPFETASLAELLDRAADQAAPEQRNTHLMITDSGLASLGIEVAEVKGRGGKPTLTLVGSEEQLADLPDHFSASATKISTVGTEIRDSRNTGLRTQIHAIDVVLPGSDADRHLVGADDDPHRLFKALRLSAKVLNLTGIAWRTTHAVTAEAIIAKIYGGRASWREQGAALASDHKPVNEITAGQGIDTELRWSRPLSDADRARQVLMGLDLNAQHLGAMKGAKLGVGAPLHLTGAQAAEAFDRNTAGLWRIECGAGDIGWHLPDLSRPSGENGQRFVPTETIVALREFGAEPEILEAYVFPATGSIKQAGEVFDRVRKRAIAEGDDDLLRLAKGLYVGAVGRLNYVRNNHTATEYESHLYRPEWRMSILGLANANLVRKVRTIYTETGLAPIGVNVDEVFYLVDDADALVAQLDTRFNKTKPGAGWISTPARELGRFKVKATPVTEQVLEAIDKSGASGAAEMLQGGAK